MLSRASIYFRQWLVNPFLFGMVLLFVSATQSGVAAQEQIRFNLSQSGYPPYVFEDTAGNPTGIMWDVLQLAAADDYTVVATRIPRKRVTELLQEGVFDVTANAVEWMSDMQGLIVSDPVVLHGDSIFILANSPISHDFTLDSLSDKRIGARLGYVYPTLEPLFQQRLLTRVNRNNHTAMLQALKIGVVDAVIMEKYSGAWWIKQAGMKNEVIDTHQLIGSVGYRFIFHEKWRKFIASLNQTISTITANGQLEEIFDRYR